jgi:hypothetical protein
MKKRSEETQSDTRAVSKMKPANTYVARTVEEPKGEKAELAFEITGTHSADAAEWIINAVANARTWPRLTQENAAVKAVAAIEEMAPQNATEAMLAVQMIAANDAALMFLHNATRENQDPDITDRNVLRLPG